MKRYQNFINGEFVEAAGKESFTKISPATGQSIYELPNSNTVDVVKAIQAAHKAYADWSALGVDERARYLNKIADLIDQNVDELAKLESEDVGKPFKLAREMDVPRAALNFRFFASKIMQKTERATEMTASTKGHFINYELRQALGVVALISPWNLPLYLLTWKIAPAIACGNTVVCKPSEYTSRTALKLAELMNQAGLPHGVCNIILGLGESAGTPLVQHPIVKAVSFTGGTVTGARLQELTAGQFKKLSLELGGKNATLVLPDADLKKHMPMIVRSSFLNQGEICLCGSRILVQEDKVEEFLQMFKEEVEKIKVGDPLEEASFMGPVIHEGHLKKIEAAVALALKENGKLVTGGERVRLDGRCAGGFFYKPTVIRDLTQCSELHQNEIFGPVVLVNTYKYFHEAIKWANNTGYGLSATVWTQDISKAHKAARELQVGTVWVNTWLSRDLRMPFGGVKQSGMGREGAEDSLNFFTESKTVCVHF